MAVYEAEIVGGFEPGADLLRDVAASSTRRAGGSSTNSCRGISG